MDKIVGIVSKATQTRSRNDDDFTDRLSSRYTVVLLAAFAVLVGFTQYVREPITCWAPVHFSKSQVAFMTSYCWVKDTYYLPWNKPIPRYASDKRQLIPYYQWIPFILTIQAVLFYLPTIVWHGLNSKAGVDADSILAAAHTFSRIDRLDDRERTLKIIGKQMDRFLSGRRKPEKHRCGRYNVRCDTSWATTRGSYLATLFIVSKLFYIGNVVGQLFFLNLVLATKYHTLGIDVVRGLTSNKDWTEESYVAFPRVTLCDFKVRGQDMVNVHSYTVQCVLPINLYNESIYVFLWYWMVLVAALSVFSWTIWLARSVAPVDRFRFVRNHLRRGVRYGSGFRWIHHDDDEDMDDDRKEPGDARRIRFSLSGTEAERSGAVRNDAMVRSFTDNYLRVDGVFLLRLIAHNTNGITTTQITKELWDNWSDKQLGLTTVVDPVEESTLIKERIA